MGRITGRLTNELLPSITTVTPRARYFAFYTWAVDTLNGRDGTQTLSHFREDFYALERLFLLGCVAHEETPVGQQRNHSGIEGANAGRRAWGDEKGPIDLDFRFLHNRFGGYGQDYVSPVNLLGLTQEQEDAEYETTSKRGERIAEAFDTAASTVDLEKTAQQESVNREEISRIGESLCLCRLRDYAAPDRQPVVEAFFALDREGANLRLGHQLQRETLSILLLLGEEAQEVGIELDEPTVLDALYYDRLPNGGEEAIDLPPSTESAHRRWQAFQAHDYYSVATEALLASFLTFLSYEGPSGGDLEAFLENMINLPLGNQAPSQLDLWDPAEPLSQIPIAELMDRIASRVGVQDFVERLPESSEEFDRAMGPTHPLSERRLRDAIEDEPDDDSEAVRQAAAGSSLLFVVLSMRHFSDLAHRPPRWQNLERVTEDDLSPARLVPRIHQWAEETETTLGDLLEHVVRKHVIQRAQRIKEERSSGSSSGKSWFHRGLEGHYHKDRDHSPSRNASRLPSALTILTDLGLLRSSGDKTELTDKGSQLLARLDREGLL